MKRKLSLIFICIFILFTCVTALSTKASEDFKENIDTRFYMVATKDVFVGENRENEVGSFRAGETYYLTIFMKNENKKVENFNIDWWFYGKKKTTYTGWNSVKNLANKTSLEGEGIPEEIADNYSKGNPSGMNAETAYGHVGNSSYIEEKASDVLTNVTFKSFLFSGSQISLNVESNSEIECGTHVLAKIKFTLTDAAGESWPLPDSITSLIAITHYSLTIKEEGMTDELSFGPTNYSEFGFNYLNMSDGPGFGNATTTSGPTTTTSSNTNGSNSTTSSTANSTSNTSYSTSNGTNNSNTSGGTSNNTNTSASSTSGTNTNSTGNSGTSSSTSSVNTSTSSSTSTTSSSSVSSSGLTSNSTNTLTNSSITSTSKTNNSNEEKNGNFFHDLWLTLYDLGIYLIVLLILFILAIINSIILFIYVKAQRNLNIERAEFDKMKEEKNNKKYKRYKNK